MYENNTMEEANTYAKCQINISCKDSEHSDLEKAYSAELVNMVVMLKATFHKLILH